MVGETEKAGMVGRRVAAEIGKWAGGRRWGPCRTRWFGCVLKAQEDGGGCNQGVTRSLCLSMLALENRRG